MSGRGLCVVSHGLWRDVVYCDEAGGKGEYIATYVIINTPDKYVKGRDYICGIYSSRIMSGVWVVGEYYMVAICPGHSCGLEHLIVARGLDNFVEAMLEYLATYPEHAKGLRVYCNDRETEARMKQIEIISRMV